MTWNEVLAAIKVRQAEAAARVAAEAAANDSTEPTETRRFTPRAFRDSLAAQVRQYLSHDPDARGDAARVSAALGQPESAVRWVLYRMRDKSVQPTVHASPTPTTEANPMSGPMYGQSFPQGFP